MSIINTNSTNRQHSAIPNKVKEIFSMSAFPPPSGGARQLEDGVEYVVSAPLVTGDRLLPPVGATGSISAINGSVNTIIYTGTGTFIEFSGLMGSFFLDDLTIISSSSGSTLFNLLGDGTAQGIVRTRFCVFINFTTVGNITNFGFATILTTGTVGYTTGLTLTNIVNVGYIQNFFQSVTAPADGAGVRILGDATRVIRINEVTQVTFGVGDGIYISPTVNRNCRCIIEDNDIPGTGNPFENGLTGNINSFTDTSIAAIAVASVDNASGVAQFSTTPASALTLQDIVTHATFTSYNGTFVVSKIIDANSYQVSNIETGVPLAFVADEAGTVANRRVRVDTAIAHGISDSTPVLIKQTFNNNGGFNAIDASGTEFFIQKAFVDTQIGGIFDTGSITETEPRLIVHNSFPIPDSMFSAEVGFTANPITSPQLVTITTQGTPVIIGGTAWLSNKFERMAINISGNGQMKNLVKGTSDVPITFSASVEKVAGGAVHIGIVVIINGVLTTVATFNPPITRNTGIIQISATRLFTLSEFDLLDLAAVNFNGTDNIEVTQSEVTIGKPLA